MSQPPPVNNQGQYPPSPPPVGQIANGHQWNGQAWIPMTPGTDGAPAGEPTSKPSKPWYKKWWVWVIIVFVLGGIGNALNGDADEQTAAPASTAPASTSAAPTPAETSASPTPVETQTTPAAATSEPAPNPTEPAPAVVAPPVSQYGDYPEAEAAFITGVADARVKYEAAETDLQGSKALSDRDKALLPSIGGSSVTNWVGVVDNVGANDEGKAYVYINISDEIKVKTWNNAFSDMSDNTLIPESSPIYDALLTMTPGQKVVFSGTFVGRDGAPLYPTNMTQTFSALTPEFLFKFSAIAPA